MKKITLLIIVALLTAIILTGCAGSAQSAPVELPPIPEGAERVTLENGAYAAYRFELPAGQSWSNYNRLTVEYMLDAANLGKHQRNSNNVRLMGVYQEDQFAQADGNLFANLESLNGPYIIDNAPRTFASMGAVADQWFTVEYNISGSAAHAQFVRSNLPAAGAQGPFFIGIGIPSQDPGRRNGITQLIRNVTLHHATNPALNVVSTGSGFDQSAFVSFYPVLSRRESPTEQ